MKSNFREVEASLIIWSENPQPVAGQIAGLTSVGNYRLLPQDPILIHDLYFDTPDRALQTPQMALRLREIGGTSWITLKGPSQPTGWGSGVERLEIEVEWSKGALTGIVEELRARGVEILPQWQDSDDAYPLAVMAGLGLEVIQDREGHRQLWNIVAGDRSSPVLAELALDFVVFNFSGQQVCYHEVEIEAKGEGGPAVIQAMVESLVVMVGPVLRTWDYGKLATGKAIEGLLKTGELQELLGVDNNLKPAALDRISDYLESRGV